MSGGPIEELLRLADHEAVAQVACGANATHLGSEGRGDHGKSAGLTVAASAHVARAR
jgi:hypothetical protein